MDFENICTSEISMELSAKYANEALDKHLATLSKIYYVEDLTRIGFHACRYRDQDDTHTALLFDVEEIRPTACEHVITVHLGTESHGTWYECRKCDKKLRASFEAI